MENNAVCPELAFNKKFCTICFNLNGQINPKYCKCLLCGVSLCSKCLTTAINGYGEISITCFNCYREHISSNNSYITTNHA